MNPFTPPEMLVLRDELIAAAADMWSFAATLLTASTGAYIIHKGAAGKDDLKRLQDDSWNFQEHVVDAFNDEQRSHWEGLPTELRSLIERCLVLNKDARPTASQILESVEFSDLRQLSRLDYTAANATAAGATGAAGDSEVVVPNVANSYWSCSSSLFPFS
jgi:serine/threonine protein kinase